MCIRDSDVAERNDARAHERRECEDVRDRLPFHVERSPAIEVVMRAAIAALGREGRLLPRRQISGRNDVRVAVERERSLGGSALEARHENRALGVGARHRHGNPLAVEDPGEKLDRGTCEPRRIRRVDAHVIPEELHGLGLHRRVGLDVHLAYRYAGHEPRQDRRNRPQRERGENCRSTVQGDAAMQTEAVKLLRDYVRIDTSNPPGITRPAIEFLARILGCEGIPVTVTGADPERPILVARLKGRTSEGTLALHNHADVVPAGDLAAWKKPPFAAERGEGAEHDHLYGRGTLDMKGQTIANVLALASLVRARIVPLRDIVFVVESGEETYDESLGMGWLVEHRPDLLAGVTDVFNEGGVNEVKAQRVERFGIEVMQKAILSVDVLSKERKPLEDFGAFLKAEEANTPIRLVPAVRE